MHRLGTLALRVGRMSDYACGIRKGRTVGKMDTQPSRTTEEVHMQAHRDRAYDSGKTLHEMQLQGICKEKTKRRGELKNGLQMHKVC